MSTKIDTTAAETQRAQTGASASPSTSSTGIKMSMFKRKPGFVIPKNKFSGSLVPIFKGNKKSESNDAAIVQSSAQLQRKTKWGPDLNQDTSVRRGKALAYQTRVGQITQQLKSGSLGIESQNPESAKDGSGSELPNIQVEFKKLQTLEHERQEAIGEILKLNPNYKAPSDYQPVVREATIPIPVKAYPDHNFLGLICGSDGETQKRLEKETGTKVQVCGMMSNTNEKVEITASDGNELISSYEEVYVQISSDTWEKVDAAAALIELLLSSVKPAASALVSGDNYFQGLSGAQDIATAHANNSSMANRELQPGVGPISTSSQGPFQPHPSSWLPTGQSNAPTSMGFQFNPLLTRPLLGPGHPAPFEFGSTHQSTAALIPRLHTPAPVMLGSFMPTAYAIGQTGSLKNLSPATSPSSLVGHQPTLAGSARLPSLQPAERPFTSPTPSGWALHLAGPPQSLASVGFPSIGSSQGSLVSQSLAVSPSQFPPPQIGRGSATSYVASQTRSSSPMPSQGGANATLVQLLISTANNALRPSQNPLPPSAIRAPSFTPLTHAGPTARRPSLPGSDDFTFQPSQPQAAPSQSFPAPGLHFASQRPAPGPFTPAPQGPYFRPAFQNTILQPIRHNLPVQHSGSQMGAHTVQFGPPNINSHVGSGHVVSVPNAGGATFPPRGGHPTQYQQNYPAPPLSRPGSSFGANMRPIASGRPQVYDPFSPTSMSAAQPQGNNIEIASKQATDAEYEDLMESVGVK